MMTKPCSAQSAQRGETVEHARSAGQDGTDIRNPGICRPNVFSPQMVAAQSALGLGLGVAGFFLGYQMDRGMGLGAGLGYMAGTTVGIWSLGKAAGGGGGYGPTVLGMMGGAVGGILLAAMVSGEAAPVVLLGALNLGSMGGYH